jgi:hypothetical protein
MGKLWPGALPTVGGEVAAGSEVAVAGEGAVEAGPADRLGADGADGLACGAAAGGSSTPHETRPPTVRRAASQATVRRDMRPILRHEEPVP